MSSKFSEQVQEDFKFLLSNKKRNFGMIDDGRSPLATLSLNRAKSVKLEGFEMHREASHEIMDVENALGRGRSDKSNLGLFGALQTPATLMSKSTPYFSHQSCTDSSFKTCSNGLVILKTPKGHLIKGNDSIKGSKRRFQSAKRVSFF